MNSHQLNAHTRRSEMELHFVLVLALVAGMQAGPIHEILTGDTCAKTCTASSKFNYEEGTTYAFQYTNEIRTSVQGASEDYAGHQFLANVHMDFISKCEANMRLTDVTFTEHNPEGEGTPAPAEFHEALERNPLRISYQDGKVEELCLAANEPIWVLNIKRGMLSVFQNNIADLSSENKVRETDVSGHCDANYTLGEVGWSNMVIKKSKNLLGCEGRQGSQSFIQGTPYTTASNVQSVPLIKSEHNCEQEISRSTGRMNSAVCRETHMFRPFSRHDSGAVTQNTQKLTFVRQSRTSSAPGPITKRVPMTFDHAYDPDKVESTRKELEQKLMEVCANTVSGVTPETPKLFTDIVYIMKTMEDTEMEVVYQKIKTGEICSNNNARVSKMFLDAIPMAGTSGSVRMMTRLLVSKAVTGIEAEMWLTTLAFITNPTTDMIVAVKPLLSTSDNKALLGVSSLVNSYCRINTGCESSLEVMKIISLLQNKIGTSCKVTASNRDTVILALRAIGNAGFGTRAIPTLDACIRSSSNPVEVRLSAIEAFRHIPCSVNKRQLISVFLDKDEDSEIRIAAYKALMECPSTEIIKTVKRALEGEEVNQVGSYVWSHLTNLMETNDPHKQDIRAILEDQVLAKAFDLDKRKFSRNYEGSFFFEKLNTGAKLESDLIWSSKSFIMRSGMLNLTVDMFGKSVNLFEIGGRVEGLEYMLESYFGPNGYFSDNENSEPAEETALKAIRPDKVNRINKRFDASMDGPKGSLYMRIFGNEIRYMSFNVMDSLLNNKRFNIIEMLMALSKNRDYSFSQSQMFLDSRIIIPTSAGFPMNLTVNGTSTIDFKASGNVDFTKLYSSPPSITINGLIQPSAAVEVSTMMSVDAFVTKSGIKMVSTLHSGTSVQGRVQLSEGKIFNAQWDFPERKMDIISMRSAFFTVHRDMEREQRMITENRQEKSICTGSKLASVTGLELCGEMQFPNASLVDNAPYFPITGPVSMGITLYKRDSHTGYKLEARSIHTGDENIVRLAFTTPESQVDRTFGVDLSLNKQATTLDMSFTSPWKKAAFQAALMNNRRVKGLSGKVNVDGVLKYMIEANVKSAPSGPGTKYTPTLEIRRPDGKPIDMAGSITAVSGKVLDVDMTLTGATQDPISFQGSLRNKLNIKGITASFSTEPGKQYLFESRIQKVDYKKRVIYQPTMTIRTPTAELLAFGGSVTHTYGKQLAVDLVLDKIMVKAIKMTGTVIAANTKNSLTRTVNMHFTSSPMDYRLHSKFINRKGRTLSADIDFFYNIRRLSRNTVSIVSKIIDQSTRSLTKAKGTMTFEVKRNPEYNIRFAGGMNHNYKHSEFDMDVRYGANMKDENTHVEASASLNHAIRDWNDASADFIGNLKYPGKGVNLITKMSHEHSGRNLESTLYWKLNEQVASSSLLLKNKSQGTTNMVGNFELSYPGQDITIEQTLLEDSDNEYRSILKAQFGKSNINKIVTTWKRSSPRALAVSSAINLHNMTPSTVSAEYNFDSENYRTSTVLQSGESKYATTLSSRYSAGRSFELTSEIEYPGRHIVANMENMRHNNDYTSRADLRWNADVDDSERLTVSGKGTIHSARNFATSVTVQYPSKTLLLNVQHNAESKLISHVDFQWEPRKSISVDTTISKTDNQLLGTLKWRSPFVALRVLDIDLSCEEDTKTYTNKLDVTWNPSQILSTTLTLRKPFSLRQLNAGFIAKTPWRVMKKFNVDLVNKIDDGSLTTKGKLSWNRQFIQADLKLTNAGSTSLTDLSGQLDIKSSYSYMRKGLLSLSHNSDGRNYVTNTRFTRNRQAYSASSEITHRTSGWSVLNNGNLTVITPEKNFETRWRHRNTLNDISSSVSTVFGEKQILVEYSGRQSFTSEVATLATAFKLQTPYRGLNEITVEGTHEHRLGQIDSTIRTARDGRNDIFLNSRYLRGNGNAEYTIALRTPYFPNDISLNISSGYENYPITGHMQLTLSPEATITADGSFNKDSNNMESSFVFTSPVKGLEQMRMSVKQLNVRGEVQSLLELQYSGSEILSIETHHRWDSVKSLQMVIESPHMPTLRAAGQAQGNLQVFNANANVEADPLLGRWSITSSWSSVGGMTASVRIDTPKPEVRYVQASLESNANSGERHSTISIEYMPNKIIKFVNIYNLEDLRNIHGTFKIVTPFEVLPYSSIGIQHRGDTREFSNSAELEYVPGKKITVASSYSTRSGQEASLSIATPFTSDITANIKNTGSMPKSFQTHAELNYKQPIVADLRVDLINTMTSSLSLKTPFPGFENIDSSFSHNGGFKQFSTQGEIVTVIGRYAANVNFDLVNTISGSASLDVPNHNIKFILTHEGSLQRFQSHIEAADGDKKITGDITVNTAPYILEATLSTPFEKIGMSKLTLTHDGSLSRFKSHAEFQLNKDVSQADVSFNMLRRIDADLTIRSPYIEVIKASVNHTGSLSRFNSRVRLSYGRSARITSSARFQIKPSVNANFQLKTPFTGLKNQEVTLKHAGNMQGFICNYEYDGDSNRLTGGLTFKNSDDGMTGEMNMNGRYFNPINIRVAHEGFRKSFHSSGQITYGKNQRINTDIKLDTTQTITGSLVVNTPFKRLNTLSIGLSHEGNGEVFNSHGEMNLNGQQGALEISFQSTDPLLASMTLTTPFNGLEEVKSSLRHTARPTGINTDAEITINGQKSEGRLMLNNDQAISGSVWVSSPYTPVNTIDVSLVNTGSLSNFNTHAEISLDGKKTEGDITFDTTEGKVTLKSLHVDDITVGFENKGSILKHVYLSKSGAVKYSAKFERAYGNNALIVVTPFDKFERTEIGITKNGQFDDFTIRAYAYVMQESHEMNLSLRKDPTTDLRLAAGSPLIKDVDLHITVSGTPLDFQSVGELTYGRSKVLAIDGQVKLDTPIDTKWTVSSPMFGAATAALHHEGSISNFKTQSEITFNDMKGNVEVSFRTGPNTAFELLVSSPFTPQLNVSMDHSGQYLVQSRTNAAIKLAGAPVVSIETTTDMESDIELHMGLTTKFAGFRRVETNLRHAGVLTNFKCHVDLTADSRRMEGDITFEPSEGIISLRSPFASDMTGKFSVTGNLLNFRSSAGMTYGTSQLFELRGNAILTSPINVEITMTTPITGFESSAMTYTYEKLESGVKSHIEFAINGRTTESEILVGTGSSLSGTFTIKSPTIEDVVSKFTFSGPATNFRSTGSLSYGKTDLIDVAANLKTDSEIVGFFSLRSPLTENIVGKLSYNGPVTNFRTATDFTYGQEKLFDIEGGFKSAYPMTGDMLVVLPVFGYERTHVSFKHDSQTNSLSNHAECTFANKKTEIDTTFSSDRLLKGSITINSDLCEDFVAEFESSGLIPNFRSTAGITYAGTKKYEIIATLDTEDSVRGDISLTTPLNGFEQMKAAVVHSGAAKRFNSHAEFTKNGEQTVGDITINIDTAMEGSLHFRSPLCQNIDMTFEIPSLSRMNSHLTYGDEKLLEVMGEFNTNPMNGNIQITTPIKSAAASFRHNGNMLNFDSNGEIRIGSHNVQGDVAFNAGNKLGGSANIKSSLFKPVNTQFEVTGNMLNFRPNTGFQYGQNKFGAEATLTTSPEFTTVLALTSPIEGYRSMRFDARAAPSSNGYESSLKLTNGRRNILLYSGDLSLSGLYEGRMSIMSMYFPTVEGSFRHQGSLQNFQSNGQVTFNGKSLSGNARLTLEPSLDGTISFSTPFTEDISATMTFGGDFNNFRSHAEGTYGTETLSGTASFSNRDGITTSVGLRTPFTGFENVNMELKHIKGYKTFSTNAEFEMPLTGKLNMDGSLTWRRRLEGELQVNTPFTGWRRASGRFSHSGAFPVSTSSASFSRGNGRYAVTSNLNGLSSGDITVNSPLPGYNNMGINYNLEGTLPNIQCTGKIISGNGQDIIITFGNAYTGNKLDTTATLSSPYTEDLAIELHHSGVFPVSTSTASFSRGSGRYALTSNLSGLRSGDITINTPLPGYNNMGMNYNLQGTLPNINYSGKFISGNGQDITVTFGNAFSGSKLDTTATLSSPYTEDLTLELHHTGVFPVFQTEAIVSMGAENSLNSETTFSWGYPSINAESTLSTVLAGYSAEQKVSFNHEHTNGNCKSRAFLKVLSKEFLYTSSMKTNPSLEAEFKLSTPFDNYRDLALVFDHSGSLNRFSTKGGIQYADSKKIDAGVTFIRYGWQRIQTSFELTTPFEGYERSKITYRHTGRHGSFECNGNMNMVGTEITANIQGQVKPLSGSIALRTPWRNFENLKADANFQLGDMAYNTEANLMYMSGKVISFSSGIDMTASPRSAFIKLTTPFNGYESSEVRVTQSGSLQNLQASASIMVPALTPPINVESNIRYANWKNVDASATFNSQIVNMENLKFSLVNRVLNGRMTTRIETNLSPRNMIVFDSVLTNEDYTNVMYRASLTTPFETLRQAVTNFGYSFNSGKYSHSFSTQYNGLDIIDYESELSLLDQPTGFITLKAPRPMQTKFVGGLRSNKYTADFFLNWNTLRNDENVRIETSYDMQREYAAMLKVTCPKYGVYGAKGSLAKSSYSWSNTGYLFWGPDASNSAGYEVDKSTGGNKVKLILPSRSLQISGSQNNRATEGAFLWDADRDQTKKIGFRSVILPSADSMKVDLTLMMPSIGKDVQVGSKMVLNRGRIIFEGKTEFTYSADERKKFSVTSRLEDVSNDWSSKNYSFSLGVSHPYTSVGVQLASHVSKSNEKLAAAIDVEYLTARRQTKTFSVSGDINKLRKSVSFDVTSPVKKISIEGYAGLNAPFKMSLRNRYDNNRPLNTMLTLDPQARSVDFNMNYDLENPSSEFHVYAKYMNTSSVATEVFHVVNRQKVTDALMSVRLNNSNLLHSRIHWTPTIFEDLRAYGLQRTETYKRRFEDQMEVIRRAVQEEIQQKYDMIGTEMIKELEPLSIIVLEEMERLVAMYESNQYHFKDIVDSTIMAMRKLTTEVRNIQQMTLEYEEILSSKFREILRNTEERIGIFMLDHLMNLLRHTARLQSAYTGIMKNVTSHPTVVSMQQKYNNYINRLQNFPLQQHISTMSDMYTSSIDNTRGLINPRLAAINSLPGVNVVTQQAKNAYKYWEIRENTEVVAMAVLDWIKSEIEDEVAEVREALMKLKRSTVTIYDPANGEIQVDVYSPFLVHSLEVVPELELVPGLQRLRRLQRIIPTDVTLPSTDISTWMPPFNAVAKIDNGRTITTFDGHTFNLDGSCTYLLAKDFANNNFSISLKNDQDRTLIVFVDGQAIEVLQNGTVLIGGEEKALPFSVRNVAISNDEGTVRIDGAGSFTAEYNPTLENYTFTLNGWYFGRTGGLLGSYDNEPSNDQMTSYGRQIDSVSRFTRTWDVGSARCR